MLRPLPALFVAGLVSLGACFGIGSEELAELEPDAAPMRPSYDADIAPLINRFCLTCHSPDAPGTQRATPFLNTEIGVEIASCRALVRAVEERSMPPGAIQRFSGVDRLTFTRWVTRLSGGDVPDCDEPFEQ